MLKKKNEFRWDPIRNEWVIIAPHRMQRPVLPANFCPFCPGAPEIKDDKWDVIVLDNKYASMYRDYSFNIIDDDHLTKRASAKGVCEVVVYSPNHNKELHELPIEHIKKVIRMWQSRFKAISQDSEIKYVFIFENRGQLIGVTLDHPHGQIYAFPYVPPLIEKELRSSKSFFERHGNCLFCEIISWVKQKRSELIIYENQDFIILMPYWAHLPLETHVYPKRHIESIDKLNESEIENFANALKVIRAKYDKLFNFKLPFMMVIHQSPVNSGDFRFYHFHVEFYPLHRAKDKIKYLAGVEMGAGTFINPSLPEEFAKKLRSIKVELEDEKDE
ncbi:MAG: galactose-1-phosphate uridylyltransferase [Candidatus Asgardarchaeia archaeon]